jgi:hypothetical protein
MLDYEPHGFSSTYRELPVYYDTKSGYSVTSVLDSNVAGQTSLSDASHYCDPDRGFRLPTANEFGLLLGDGLRNVLFGLRIRDHLTDDQARQLFGVQLATRKCHDLNGEDYEGKGYYPPESQAEEWTNFPGVPELHGKIPPNPFVTCVIWSQLTQMSIFATGVPEAESGTLWSFPGDRNGLSWNFNNRGSVPFCVGKKAP